MEGAMLNRPPGKSGQAITHALHFPICYRAVY